MDKLFIKREGYENTPAIKDGENSFTELTGVYTVHDPINKSKVRMSSVEYLLWQLNTRRPLMAPQIQGLDELDLPLIDIELYFKYDKREAEIIQATETQKKFKKAGFKLLDSTKLIKVKDDKTDQPCYYLVKDGKYTECSDLLDEKDLKKATEFNLGLFQFKKQLADNLTNEYEEQVTEMNKIWKEI